jgi:tRNA A37 N6-isopentenylltransferase MiaA
MLTFLSLWEQMKSHEDQPLTTGGSSLAMQTISAGLNLRGEDAHKTFWDDFIQLCNNSAGLAELLDVTPEQVSKWTLRINQLIEQARREGGHNSDRKNLISTGDLSNDHPNNPF